MANTAIARWTTVAALALLAGGALAQTGSVLSDLAKDDVQQRYREQAAEQIACPPLADYDTRMTAFEKDMASKWDRFAMGCATEYGSQALDDLSLPSNLIWALVTFRTDNIETYLTVLGADLEYFDALSKLYSDTYQGIEMQSELGLRWEKTRERGQAIVERIEPLVDGLTEARILRAAFNLISTQKEATPEAQNVAMASAIEDLNIAIEEKPEALDGLAQLLLGQVLMALPAFLGGDEEAARGLLETAHRLNPNDLSVHRALAELYLGDRQPENAVGLLQAALDIDVSKENPQDYVDDMKFLSGLALRADQAELAQMIDAKRAAMLDENPFLLTRKEVAAMGHGGDDPFAAAPAPQN